MSDYAIKPQFARPNSFVFSINDGRELLRLDAEGFHFMGETVSDAGEAYELFMSWLAAATEHKGQMQ